MFSQPIIGGAVSQSYLGWRWVECPKMRKTILKMAAVSDILIFADLVVILVSVIVVLDIFLLPETFAPVILTRKAQQLRWKTERWALHSRQEMKPFSLNSFLHKNLMLPLKMIVMEPMVTVRGAPDSTKCSLADSLSVYVVHMRLQFVRIWHPLHALRCRTHRVRAGKRLEYIGRQFTLS